MNSYFVIRHGQDQDNAQGILNGHRDNPLTDIGISQANKLAQNIKNLNLKIDLVLTSPLARTKATADIVSQYNNFPKPSIEPLLIERNFGVMTGEKQIDIPKLCSPNIIQSDTINYFLNPPGAEIFPDLIARSKEFFSKYDSQYNDKNILLVTHGDFGKMLYCAFYNLKWPEVLTAFHFGNSEMLQLTPSNTPQNSKLITIKQYNT